MFVDFFIRRPIFASVCAILIVLVGAIAIPSLPVAQYPELAPPQVTVAANYNGANAEVVESAVTRPLEEAINGVEGLKYLTSTSGNDGTSIITATFDVTRSIDLAAVDIQNRVNSAEGVLPNEVKTTGISITKQSSNFVLAAGFYADKNQYDNLFISNYLDVYVRDALKRVPGVADVQIFGERKYAMRLWLDPDRLAGRGLTAGDVVSALQEQNVEVAAGQVGGQPANQRQSYQISVRAMGRLSDPTQFDNIVLKTNPDGTLVKLKDVGRAELGAESYDSALEYNGIPAMGIGVQQLPTANALDVDRGVKAALTQLSKTFPPGLKYAIAFDTTTAVNESIHDVLRTLVEAIILVILVMFLFLQDWRITLIPAITIPVSLIGTFAFVKLFGFSINTLTLFGITLATGLVVDDAIVVIENVERHISEGITETHNASSVAMREVTSAVIATSLVLVAVFVPVALFPGTTGILFRQFALTIAFSITISAFNALTLTPALSALLLREVREHRGIFHLINRGIHAFTTGYRHLLHGLIRWRWAVAVAFVLCLAATWWVFKTVPTGFVPQEDQGYIIIQIQAPPGASLAYTANVARQAEAVVGHDPDVNGAFAVTGFSFAGSAPNAGLIFASLKPFAERPGPSHSAHAVVARLQPKFFGIPGAMVIPFEPPAIQGIGAFGGFQFELIDQGSNSLDDLAGATQKMVMAGNANPHLQQLFSSFTADDPQFVVTVDRDQAKRMNVPLSQITNALQVYLGSVYVNDFDFNDRSYRVYIQADRRFRANPQDIRQYYVHSNRGQMIPLSSLVQIHEGTSPRVINHYNLFRSAEIDGSAAPGYSSGQAIQTMQQLAATVLPRGMSYEWTGLSLEEIQSGSKAAALFALGLLVVYLTLAALYESWVLPFIIMLAVPIAILGGLGGVALRGLIDNIYCQIGLVMLIGLASKNAILVVEFAEQLRGQGHSIMEAAIEAARIRLRPILMTSLAFMLGVVPLMVAAGAGQEGRHSVGTTVFGGMLVSTFLNLIFIPVLYYIVRSIFHGGKRHGKLPAES